VGDTLASASFNYDTRLGLSKDNGYQMYDMGREDELDYCDIKPIEVSSPRQMNRETFKRLYSNDLKINKNSTKLCQSINYTMIKNDIRPLNTNSSHLSKYDFKGMSIDFRGLIQNDIKHLGVKEPIFINKEENKSLLINDRLLINNSSISLAVDCFNLINKNSSKYFTRASLEMGSKEKIMTLQRITNLSLNLAKEQQGLSIPHIEDISIFSPFSLQVKKETGLTKQEASPFDVIRDKELNKFNYNKSLIIENTQHINKGDNSNYIIREKEKPLNLINSQFMNNKSIKLIHRDNSIRGVYTDNNLLLFKSQPKTLAKEGLEIMKDLNSIYYNLEAIKSIYKMGNVRGLNKELLVCLIKPPNPLLIKEPLNKILLCDILNLGDEGFRNINIQKTLKGLNKSRVDTLKPLNKSIIKGKVDITKNHYHFNFLEVTKRWWVLSPTNPKDYKILPLDYNYSKKPLEVNRRDRAYGNLININSHPISYMPYLENNKGVDLHWGLHEIGVSIEIMIDVVNILIMIIKHSASQFANCSGQEAIEFIMELFLDWLNLDTTISEMSNKNSREHYLRCYRWLRWEAEKIWFVADENPTQDKMSGIKYAGMLFENLADYMKYHHFNSPPLWRNLTHMDIERQFNKIAGNNDLIKPLDKLKGKRHYYIETKNLGGR
jgi:hypothetical protein